MKKTNKILSIFLALLMMATIIPMSSIDSYALYTSATGEIVYEVGDIIAFGSYPQSQVTDTYLITFLESLPKTWKSYNYYSGNGSTGTMVASDYMRYADVELMGDKYRAVTFDLYRPKKTRDECLCYPSNAQVRNGYSSGEVYWFKYEPLQWRVLDPFSGLVMCESIIDAQAFSNTIYRHSENLKYYQDKNYTNYANNYVTSSIRKWLNKDFYNTAFSDEQKKDIIPTERDNKALYEGYNCASTVDNISLLSYDEIQNSAYGFSSKLNDEDITRKAQGTDYAKSQGLYVSVPGDTAYGYDGVGNSFWWMRSPGYYPELSACCVADYGCACNIDVDYIEGIRPICNIIIECEHNYEVKTSTEPTCTEAGNSTHECIYCHDTYYKIKPASGHLWETETCTANKVCLFCGATDGQPLGHSYTSTVIKSPTCTATGTSKYTCSRCSDTYTETIPAKGHTMVGGHCTVCGYYNPADDIYNIGEETYKFKNFGDTDSPGGHCFGMSMTSAGYYNNILDITNVGGNINNDVYGLSLNNKVKGPICYYQDVQGKYANGAIVAGGKYYLNKTFDINSDWKNVINYVKNHNYDNKGTLQIGFRKDGQGGHAINFLRYEVVSGQERIYAYDNNFPDIETYFYKASDGKIYQAPKSTFNGSIDCIALRDVNKFFGLAKDYDAKRYIYGNENEISISGATAYPMECGDESYMMFEIPDGVEKVVITPLVDNATFQYCDDEYSFGNTEDDTVGIFTLATDDDESMSDNFVITNMSLSVQNPSRNEIRNKDGIILHATVEGNAPADSYVVWTSNNSNFDEDADGSDLTVVAKNKGYTTFTATLYDVDGNILMSDSVELYSKSGFFDKIGGFFRALFGNTTIYEY